MSDHSPSPALAGGLDRLIADGRIDTVMVGLPDQQGRLAGKRYDGRHYLQHVRRAGMEMCAYTLAHDVDRIPIDAEICGWDEGFGDVIARPDDSTLVWAPWVSDRTALVLADPYRDGVLVPIAPRVQLQHQLEALAHMGLTAHAGLEGEFVLCEGGSEDNIAALRPGHPRNADYSLDPTPLDAVCSDLTDHLRAATIPFESVKLEGAPGQVEFTIRYGPALQAADRHLLLKHAATRTARAHGMCATFMAAPGSDIVSGLHIHLSLHRDGQPVLPGDQEHGLSETGEHAIAGLLHLMPHLMPMYAPTPNSYRRYRPHSFAPTRSTWGIDNRSVAVRVTGHGTSRHLEIRLPGADAQPHRALAAILAGVRYGLDQRPPLPAPVTGDGYALSSASADPLPTTLPDALRLFGGAAADTYIGPEALTFHRRAAQHEIAALDGHVPDTERRRYLDRV
ncbi:glutamine synthetase family protein [Streptomyces sp. NRRL F-5053]|uniref:glutamine synthetase family protein n=1 Tax=Streptomyces sp. NRRL F-5053 TaxID=1463854 RepID=UPI00068AB919|nr:glutamine synthetase family protein [Streptomyces sp. NRRL F-5053]